MAVWLYGSHKFMTILLRFLSWNVPFWKNKMVSTETIHTLRIVSFCILSPVYMNKRLPGKEGHPSSRVNFIKCLHEEQVDPFDWANSAPKCFDCLKQHLSMLWLSKRALAHALDLAGCAKVFTWRVVGLARRVTLPLGVGHPSSQANSLFLM